MKGWVIVLKYLSDVEGIENVIRIDVWASRWWSCQHVVFCRIEMIQNHHDHILSQKCSYARRRPKTTAFEAIISLVILVAVVAAPDLTSLSAAAAAAVEAWITSCSIFWRLLTPQLAVESLARFTSFGESWMGVAVIALSPVTQENSALIPCRQTDRQRDSTTYMMIFKTE